RPVGGRARHRHLGEHEGPEAVRRDRRGDHVRAGHPVERHVGRLRLRLQAVHLRRPAVEGSANGISALQTLAYETNGEFLQATNRTALIAVYGRISADIGGTFTFTYRS